MDRARDLPRPADTIVALATPPGRGGVGIVRISGPDVAAIAGRILGSLPAPRYAGYFPFRDAAGEIIDTGIALYFLAPHSFTGEDVLELQGHGGTVVMDLLQRRVVELGARRARPGEFSERAFLNGKMDLAQAEAIADLIESSTEQAARAATRSLQGEFSARINALIEQLIQMRMYVESAIDFPEEEIDFLSDTHVGTCLQAVSDALQAVLHSAHQGSLLREGVSVVIAGPPNAGKSSLLNCLAGRDSAIVTEVPGTTRDVLCEHIHLAGLPLRIIDTAGLRASQDRIEQEGMRRARAEIVCADRVLWVVDVREDRGTATRAAIQQLQTNAALTIVHNKIDLSGHEPRLEETAQGTALWLSAKTGVGLDLLHHHLKESLGYQGPTESTFTARRRHLDALHRAEAHLEIGRRQWQAHHAGELLAEELRQAQNALCEITGVFAAEDLLGRIFSSFCIGK